MQNDKTIRPTKIEPAEPVTGYRTPIPKKDFSKEYEKAKAAYKIPYRPSMDELIKMFVEKQQEDQDLTDITTTTVKSKNDDCTKWYDFLTEEQEEKNWYESQSKDWQNRLD